MKEKAQINQKSLMISLVINLLIAVITTGVVISYFFVKSKTIHNGWESFRYFTTDSNILAAVAAIVTAVFNVRKLKNPHASVPRAVELLKYVATTAVLLTFCTVMFFLIPKFGVELLLGGTGFHMHVGAPMMMLFSFGFLEKDTRISIAEAFLGLLPTVIYGAVYLTEVVFIGEKNGGWRDFYAFNQNGNWMLTVVLMLTATYLISFLLRLLHNRGITKQV